MKITVRIDDITPDMDWDKFNRFKQILDDHNIRPLIGVVPDNKDNKLKRDLPREDFYEFIRTLQQKGWIIAMHGYNHVYTTRKAGLFPISDKSEFAGLCLAVQDEMIREGKRILKQNGIITDFFMAPSHSYDNNTLKALKKNGFSRITDGFGKEPYQRSGMVFYPISVSKARTLKDESEGIVTFVYHTNTMDEKDFANFEKLFDSSKVVSYDEFFCHEAVNRGLIEEIREYVTACAKYAVVHKKLIR